MLSILAGLCIAASPPTSSPASAPSTPGQLFGWTKTWTIHIHVTRTAWQTMQPVKPSRLKDMFAGLLNPPTTQKSGYAEGDRLKENPFGYEFAFVKGTVDFEGQQFSDVGVRFKGNSSYAAAGNGPRRPFKLDFARFVSGGEIAGLRELNLHNNAYDPSHLREALSYDVYRSAGVPSARTAWALVYLTVDGLYKNEFVGLYTIVEEVDKQFLKEHFKDHKGLLLKPENVFGGLAFFGDKWTAYEGRYRPKTPPTTQATSRIIDLARLVNQADEKTFRRQIASYIDLDELARYLAATVMLSNMDSPLTTGHNFYMYLDPHTDLISWMPWDLNLSFGAFTVFLVANNQANLSIARPYTQPNALLDRLFAMDQFQAMYRAHLAEMMQSSFQPRRVGARIDQFAKVLQKTEQAARAAGKLGNATTRPATITSIWLQTTPDLKPFIAARVESVKKQLAGQSEGVSPGGGNRAPAATRPTTRR